MNKEVHIMMLIMKENVIHHQYIYKKKVNTYNK
jgi:hypothetical protein